MVICCFRLSLELQRSSILAETSEIILCKLSCSVCSDLSEGKSALSDDKALRWSFNNFSVDGQTAM